MAPAIFDTVAVDLLAGPDGPQRTVLRANGSTLIKPGYISVYQEGMDDAVQDDSDHVLPPMQRRRSHQAPGRDSGAAFHRAAAALLRSLAGQGAGGIRHRPPLDLRLHHLDAARPRVRGNRKPPLHRDRHRQDRQPLPDAVLHDLRRLRLHGEDGRLSRRGRDRRAGMGAAAREVLEAVHRSRQAHRNLGQPRGGGAGARLRDGSGERQTDERAHGPLRTVRADRHQGRRRQAAFRGPAARPKDGCDHPRRGTGAVQAAPQARVDRRRARRSSPTPAASGLT